MTPAAFYIDGYNLYHGLDGLRRNHLKWLCLKSLAERLVSVDRRKHGGDEALEKVAYFSAWARHRHPKAYQKQLVYVKALEASGVECEMAHFKRKRSECKSCGDTWWRHEEKESDVGIAVSVLHDAFRGRVGTFYVLSGDTDLAPLFRFFREQFPQKRLVSVAPPSRPQPTELTHHASAFMAIYPTTLERCLLGAVVRGPNGAAVCHRPSDYDPPSVSSATGAPPVAPVP